MAKDNAIKVVCRNNKATHDYFIHETYEAGIELKGTEVKSLRAGHANISESCYAEVKDGELFVENMNISPYEQGNIFNHDAKRRRRLLMHKREILRLFSKTREKGFTLIPLKVYFKNGRAKLELALASGKHTYDKRAALAEKSAKRDMERAIREREKS